MSRIYDMKLHTTIFQEDENAALAITRVAGGWLYRISDGRDYCPPVFVPYDNSHMKRTRCEETQDTQGDQQAGSTIPATP